MAKPRSCARSTPVAARQPATRRTTASTPLLSSTTPDSAASGSSPAGTSPSPIADSTASTTTVATCAHSTGRQRRDGGPPVGKTSATGVTPQATWVLRGHLLASGQQAASRGDHADRRHRPAGIYHQIVRPDFLDEPV